MRDALLAVSGRLDARMGGRGVPLQDPPFSTRRTVYGFIDRQNLDGVYRTFDFASPDSSSPRRFATTVPQQALYLMNSPFVIDQARALAAQLDHDPADDDRRVAALYRVVLGRAPDSGETIRALAFLSRLNSEGHSAWNPPRGAPAGLSSWEALAQALLLSNEFQFVD
jgi:hypothetical protein